MGTPYAYTVRIVLWDPLCPCLICKPAIDPKTLNHKCLTINPKRLTLNPKRLTLNLRVLPSGVPIFTCHRSSGRDHSSPSSFIFNGVTFYRLDNSASTLFQFLSHSRHTHMYTFICLVRYSDLCDHMFAVVIIKINIKCIALTVINFD